MDRIAKEITSSFLQQLPSNTSSIATKDLLTFGFPGFLVSRIKLELENRFEQSIQAPESEWVDMSSKPAVEAWQKFLWDAREAAVLPVEYAEEVIEASVLDTLKLAVQPRRYVPELLFRQEGELNAGSVQSGLAYIVVNKHLAIALERYMQKKDRESITIDKAKEVIELIDEKLVDGYNPLNWLDLLTPLFSLTGPAVSSDLIRMFFEDKSRHVAAKTFDHLEKNISETEFIEIMSSAELIEFESFERDEQTLFDQPVADVDIEPDQSEKQEKTDTDPDEDEEPWMSDEWDETDEDSDEDDDDTEEVAGLNELFHTHESETNTDEDDEEEFVGFDFSDAKESEESSEDNLPDAENEKHQTAEKENDGDVTDHIEAEIEKGADHDSHANISEVETEEDQHEDVLVDFEETQDFEPEKTDEEPEMEEESGKEQSLLSRFTLDDETFDESEFETPEREPETIYDELNLVKEDRKPGTIKNLFDDFVEDVPEDDIDSDTKTADKDSEKIEDSGPVEAEDKQAPAGESGTNDDDTPMWKSFLDRGDVEEENSFTFDDEEYDDSDDEVELEKLDEDGFIEEPIYDLTKEEAPVYDVIAGLAQWLDDEKERFISEIFDDSEIAYELALAEIIQYDDWKSASKYIERDVFTRNRIDLYSEVAVDFTDRLHTYFIEFKT